jgi:hypothetical protein
MANPNATSHNDHQQPPARESIERTRADRVNEAQEENAETAAAVPDVRMGGDIGFDRVVGPDEAGLGRGLDQAEEAQLGVTDEEIEQRRRERAGLR